MRRIVLGFVIFLNAAGGVLVAEESSTNLLPDNRRLTNSAATNSSGSAVTNEKPTNTGQSNMGFRLENTRFTGNLLADIYGTWYNFKLEFHWRYRTDKLHTHLQIDNGDAYNTFSLLGRYSFIHDFTERFYPFAILKSDLYTEYPDGVSSGEAGRLLWGGGIDLKVIKGKIFNLFVSTGIDITHDINRELPAMTSWWRSQAVMSLKLFKKLKLSVHGVLSWPFDGSLQSWYDVTTSAGYKLSKEVSLVGSLRFYNHKVLEASGDGYRHTISVAVDF